MRWHPKDPMRWMVKFAWIPTKLNDGQMIWFEWYERRVTGYTEQEALYESRLPRPFNGL